MQPRPSGFAAGAMIRMLLVDYCFGIRLERRLCEDVHLNLSYRWFCRLGSDGAVPGHCSFSKDRRGCLRRQSGAALDRIMRWRVTIGLRSLTVLVVNEETGRPGDGLLTVKDGDYPKQRSRYSTSIDMPSCRRQSMVSRDRSHCSEVIRLPSLGPRSA
jgi:hypothetical protein